MSRLCLLVLVVSSLLLAACAPEAGSPGDVPPGEPSGADTRAPPRSDTLLPVHGTRLWVHREGAGEPAVVVHGGPVLDHGYLRGPLAPLGGELELVFYDQRLSGRSEGEVDSASVRLDTFVEDIEGVRAALGLGRIHLVGHSWGGLLALGYAVAHPERLRSLILVSPMAPSAALWQEEERAAAALVEPGDTAGLGALRQSEAFAAREPGAVEEALRMAFRSQLHDPDLAEDLEFHIAPDYGERSRRFGFMLPDLLDYDLTGRLSAVTVPTLLVYGADEPGGEIGGRALRRGLPDVTHLAIPDAGHFPFLEEGDAFLEAVRAFLEKAGGPR